MTPLSWQTPVFSLVGTRLCSLAAYQTHMDSSVYTDCEHWWHTRDTPGPFACNFQQCGTWWYILDSLANKRDFLWRALHSLGRWNWTKEKPMSVSDRTLINQKRCPLKKYSGLKHGRWESKRKEIKSITISTPSLGRKWRKKNIL